MRQTKGTPLDHPTWICSSDAVLRQAQATTESSLGIRCFSDGTSRTSSWSYHARIWWIDHAQARLRPAVTWMANSPCRCPPISSELVPTNEFRALLHPVDRIQPPPPTPSSSTPYADTQGHRVLSVLFLFAPHVVCCVLTWLVRAWWWKAWLTVHHFMTLILCYCSWLLVLLMLILWRSLVLPYAIGR